MIRIALPTLLIAARLAAAAQTLLQDDFKSDKHPSRSAPVARGKWSFDSGVASCAQDDALFKKNKNHGPIMQYALPFSQGTIEFSYKPQGVQNFVFTLNAETGHLFRYVHNKTGLAVRCWPKPGHDQTPKVLTPAKGTKTPPLEEGKWIDAKLVFKDQQCTITLGDFTHTYQDPAIGQKAAQMSLGFSYGSLAIKNVKITGN